MALTETDSNGAGLDIFDREVARLTRCPEQIPRSWERAEPLFRYAAPDDATTTLSGEPCGCLTMIRSGRYAAYCPDLTRRIRHDERLPASVEGITPADLPLFARYMRELNRRFGWGL
ncbi:MAG: hypothetical protein V3U35_00775 [Candidatus Neomarinimicrobiota bacterium]